MNDRDIDAEFDAIVSRWEDASTRSDAGGTAPAGDDAANLETPPTPPAAPPGPVPPVRPLTVHDITASYAALSRPEVPETPETLENPEASREPDTWRASPERDDDDEDHFEPPTVHLPPSEDIGYWGALLGLVGGPLVLLWVLISHPFNRGWWIFGAILLFLGGFALLVMRQPHERDPFDDDDGARV